MLNERKYSSPFSLSLKYQDKKKEKNRRYGRISLYSVRNRIEHSRVLRVPFYIRFRVRGINHLMRLDVDEHLENIDLNTRKLGFGLLNSLLDA